MCRGEWETHTRDTLGIARRTASGYTGLSRMVGGRGGIGELLKSANAADLVARDLKVWLRHSGESGGKPRESRGRRRRRRESFRLIRDGSTLNVRIQTRSPLAREDLGLFRSCGDRLLPGASLPTLDPGLARVHEPNVPAPQRRLKLLLEAGAAGIPTLVAVAPVFPECGYGDLEALFGAVSEADPVTIFMEPVNLRLGIDRRIQDDTRKRGREIDIAPCTDGDVWADYAVGKLRGSECAASKVGVAGRLHLWPDTAPGSRKVVSR